MSASFPRAASSLTVCMNGHEREPGKVCRKCPHRSKNIPKIKDKNERKRIYHKKWRVKSKKKAVLMRKIAKAVQAGIDSGFFGAWPVMPIEWVSIDVFRELYPDALRPSELKTWPIKIVTWNNEPVPIKIVTWNNEPVRIGYDPGSPEGDRVVFSEVHDPNSFDVVGMTAVKAPAETLLERMRRLKKEKEDRDGR